MPNTRPPRAEMSRYELRNRYPRLLTCMQYAAILSEGEALGALRDLATLPKNGGAEAVVHFGGPLAVVRAAIRARHFVRTRFPYECSECWQCNVPHLHDFDRRIRVGLNLLGIPGAA
jgi:hypothetical protein